MQAQHHRSCVLPADVPLLEDTPVSASSSQHRGVLQKRFANWPQEYSHSSTLSRLKQSCSPSPAPNVYAQRAVPAGTYYTGNVHAQHIGLAGFGIEKPEKQVMRELEDLYKLLGKSDKYMKYREKQPSMTPDEVIARDAADKKERERKKAEGIKPDQKDTAVWPDFLEHAFWKALVKWPPMGRKKFMLKGVQRGRNELIHDSIYSDTRISRDRKQVSSHLQVLKAHLKGQPRVLAYMTTNDDDKKRHRGHPTSHAYRSHHLRGHEPLQRTGTVSKYDYDTSSPQQLVAPHSDMVQGEGLSSSPFAVTQFAMWVDGDGQPGHYFTQLHSGGRRDDLNVPDIGSWRRQYPEFDFLLPQMDDWRRTDRKVLICDASIKVMTEVRSNVYLHIDFNLQSYVDLSGFESFVCTTRFFDSGDISPDPQFDYGRHDMKDSKKLKDLKEHRADCAYEADASGSRLRVPFGSLFWGNRIAKYQTFRHKDENRVRDSLLRLTATQDIYGILPDTGEAQCLLTILWRFQQTNNSAGAGDMKWRTASFANFRTVAEPKWIQEEEYKLTAMGDAEGGDEEAREDPVTVPDDMSLYHQVPQFPLDYSHGAAHPSHHPYEVRPHHQHHPLPLSLDILTSMQPDLDHNDASAPTTATDYSHQSFARSQQHDNDFDFTGGQINISGTFEPSINISAYDGFASQSTALDGLHALTGTGLEPDGFAGFGLALGENGQLINVESSNELPNQVDLACYSTKPNWNPGNVIPQLENAAAQYHPYLGHNDSQATHGHDGFHGPHTYSQGGDLVTHGLPDPNININPALWALQSPFHEDTGSGAINRTNCRKEQAHGLGFGVLDLIERDQRARGY